MGISKILSPVPERPLKRVLEDFNSTVEPGFKRRQPIIYWLNNLPPSPPSTLLCRTESLPPALDSRNASPPPFQSRRPQSLPPKLDSIMTAQVTHNVDEESQSLVLPNEILREHRKDISERSSTRPPITKIKTSDPAYRSVLAYNYVHMDKTGLDMPDDVKKVVQKEILKGRESPPLSQDALNDAARSMARWSSTTENVVAGLTNSPLFPIQQDGLGLGGNSQWPTAVLPCNLCYAHPLSAPKPDFHVGYPVGIGAPWSAQEAHVVDHPYAKPYMQPATGNSLPFFTLELKSEATRSTLWHAENQAAGSGTYCVKAMQWLMQQAEPDGASSALDTISFSVAANARHAMFYVHYHSPGVEAYVMSYVKSCTITDPTNIQICRNIVKNITEYGLGIRLKTLRTCLQKVYSQTNQWPNKRPSSVAEPPESSTTASSSAMIVSVSRNSQRTM